MWIEKAKIICKEQNINFCRAVEYQLELKMIQGKTPKEAIDELKPLISNLNNFTLT